MDNPYAPRVFEDGRRVRLLEASGRRVRSRFAEEVDAHEILQTRAGFEKGLVV